MMRHVFKIGCLVLCSLLLALPLDISGKDIESHHGCSMKQYSQMNDFYAEKKNSIDVLVVGDSNIYRGFSPLSFWQMQHTTAYALATPSQPAWLSYYVVQDALQYQKPKVIVFEINELFSAAKGKSNRYCRTINTMHNAKVRLQAIADTSASFDDEDREVLYRAYQQSSNKQSKIALFHKRKTGYENRNLKGYLYNNRILPMRKGNDYMARYNMLQQLPKENEEYIKKIIDLCRKEKITLLFVKFPSKEWTRQKSEMAAHFAFKQHIPLLDMNVVDIGIDWSKDTKDSGFHMNDNGAQKVTSALHKYIVKYVILRKTQDTEVISAFEASLQLYHQKQGK